LFDGVKFENDEPHQKRRRLPKEVERIEEED